MTTNFRESQTKRIDLDVGLNLTPDPYSCQIKVLTKVQTCVFLPVIDQEGGVDGEVWEGEVEAQFAHVSGEAGFTSRL